MLVDHNLCYGDVRKTTLSLSNGIWRIFHCDYAGHVRLWRKMRESF